MSGVNCSPLRVASTSSVNVALQANKTKVLLFCAYKNNKKMCFSSIFHNSDTKSTKKQNLTSATEGSESEVNLFLNPVPLPHIEEMSYIWFFFQVNTVELKLFEDLVDIVCRE